MKCLTCGTQMIGTEVTTKKASITYDMCERCGSLWLDAGQLDKMAFQVQGSIEYCEQEKDDESEKQARKCPRCDDFNLSKVRFLESDIFLHYCRNCGGFWLDGGQLNLIDENLQKTMPVSGKGFSDFVNNVHVPYWFKRIKKPSEETDFHVEAPPIRGAELKGATPDECPACKNKLNQYAVFSMNFEGCPKCKGIWLVRDELRKLKNKVQDGSLRWLNNEIEGIDKTHAIGSKRPCVKCKNVRMVSVIFGESSILIDWCPNCHGIWLDRGEFEAITNYLRRELMSMHPGEIEKQAAEDAKRIWSGGPETRFEELLDAKAAVSALINATIFEHPALFNLCMGISRLPVR